MPARKKDPSTRVRRNKASTAATLQQVEPPEVADYSSWTVAQLKAEIDRLNADRSEDFQLPKRGSKADLVEVLSVAASPVPELPARADGWNALVVKWWGEAWTSPMSLEWHPATDYFNVLVCAYCFQDIFSAETPTVRLKAMAELRQQRSDLGLAPYPRRRLEWTIETADEAKAKGDKRRSSGASKSDSKPAEPAADPLLALVQ